jgi:hypothetical protein
MVVKIWPNDPCYNCKPNVGLKEYLKEEDFMGEEKHDLLEKVDFFEQFQVDNDYFCGLFLWGCGWGRKLVLQLGKVLHSSMKNWGSILPQVILFWILLVSFLFC